MNDNEGLSAMEIALDQWRRRKWLFIASFLSVFTVAICLIAALPPLYRASTTLLFSQDDIAESLLRTGATNELELRLGAIHQAVMSRSRLQEVIDEFDLYADAGSNAAPESLIQRLRNSIRIDQRSSVEPQWGQQSIYTITISFQDWDAELVAPVANALAARFRAENERIRSAHATRKMAFVREELAAAKARFDAQERRIDDFKNTHMGELPEQQAFNMATLERLNAELRLNGERQLHLLELRESVLSGSAGSAAPGITGLAGAQRLERLRRDLAERLTRLTGNHPDIIRLRAEIDSLEGTLAADAGTGTTAVNPPPRTGANLPDLESESRALRAEEQRVRSAIAGLVRTLEGTPRIEQELTRIAYEHEIAGDEYLVMQKHYQEAYLAESLETRQDQQVRVIEAAIPPDGPVDPNRERLFLLGFSLAVAFAGLVLMLAARMDGSSFHAVAEIRRFTTLPVLASIPRIWTPRDRWLGTIRFAAVSALVGAGLLVTASTSYYVGAHAHQLVLAISS